MRKVKTAALAAVLLVLPVVASATEAPKGVGKLGCVKPIIPGTRGHGLISEPSGCEIIWAKFQSGWCARTISDAKDWPWTGPFADQETAAINAWHAAFGHGC